MELKHLYTLAPGKQIWRILLSDSNKIYIEGRDKDKKEVDFSSYELETGEAVFENFQFEEKFWIGIEQIYKDILFMHKYPRPDLPVHNEIIAFDSASQKVLWSNSEGSYQFIYDDKVYLKTTFSDTDEVLVLDYLTGERLPDSISTLEMNEIYNKMESEKNYDDYNYPDKLYDNDPNAENIKATVLANAGDNDVQGEFQYLTEGSLLVSAIHTKKEDGKMTNTVFANNLNTGEILLQEIADDNLELFAIDSFFMFKNYLFLLKEKKQVDVYKLGE